MIIKDWKKDVLTIPNLLSLFRLLLIPVYIIIYLNATELHQYFLAGGILVVSCLTDMIDGKIARHFNMISTVGKILDPLADKATQFALMICLYIKHPVLSTLRVLKPILALFIIKEFFQLIVGFINLRKGKILPGALLAGKICTTILFLSLIILVLMPNLSASAVNAIAIVDGISLCIAFVQYILAYFGRNTKVQDMEAK